MDFLQKTDKTHAKIGEHAIDPRLIAREPKWLRVILVILLFCLTILAISITILFYYGKPREVRFVDANKVQAVFLNDGQVYYGKINDINDNYLDLQNIYYAKTLPANAKGQAANFAITKLGCEAHGPTDEMIVNRSQVSFWENLSSDSKVSKQISQWSSDHSNGLDCAHEATAVTNSGMQAAPRPAAQN